MFGVFGVVRVGIALIATHGAAQADCIDDAAAFHHVNVGLMRAIAQVESGTRTNVINPNTDGSFDIGLMQINSSWLPRLSQEGITKQSLFDPCTNAYVGAWILSENIRQFGPTWIAIGAYNASSPDKRLAYAHKVYDAAQSIVNTPDSPMPILPPSYMPPQTYNPFASLAVNQVKLAPHAATTPSAPAALMAKPGAASAAATPGTFHFDWTIEGVAAARPVQVFDDGSKIYVQFGDLKKVPAIFSETPRGRVILQWEAQPPYAVISAPADTLVFQLGDAEAKARRTAHEAPLPAGGVTTQAAKAPTGATVAASPAGERKATSAASGALWYVSVKSGASGTSAGDVQSDATQTEPTAQVTPIPTVAAPAPAPAENANRSNVNTDALWYLSK
ncbi:lytic transglycosylase domain-containing protein [Paraburkholderia acidisoli]|uniref:lytic transglycosylase domain-containing protein n=1 Tax=Paraburkholderia acidisoli TaxID=2571748 RepID=UPI001E4F5A53|nr:transglycosylase SLT domain-containing protein [Paraburkholderia acidisoli]